MSSLLNIAVGILIVISMAILMPVGNLPTPISSSIQTIFGYMYMLNPILPITTILTILQFYFGMEISIFLWKGLNWIGRTLRGI